MYRIMLLKRSGGKEPLWTPFMIQKPIASEPTSLDIEQGDINPNIAWEEYGTENQEELEETVLELLKSRGSESIRIVDDLQYLLDVIISG